MYTLSYKDLPKEQMRTYYTTAKQLIIFFEREIWVEDIRSKTTPRTFIGLVIGVTLDKIQLRTNNNITDWFPLNNDKIKFFL